MSLSLPLKYKPKSWGEVVGQRHVVGFIRQYLVRPERDAFLFTGRTGTGKTAVTDLIVSELTKKYGESKVGLSWYHGGAASEKELVDELIKLRGGHTIGQASRGDPIQPSLDFGESLKVFVLNQFDRFGTGVKSAFLPLLDEPHLWGKDVLFICSCVDINDPTRELVRRFGTGHLTFESRTDVLRDDCESLIERIWRGEGMESKPPTLADLGLDEVEISISDIPSRIEAVLMGVLPLEAKKSLRHAAPSDRAIYLLADVALKHNGGARENKDYREAFIKLHEPERWHEIVSYVQQDPRWVSLLESASAKGRQSITNQLLAPPSNPRSFAARANKGFKSYQ